MIYELRDYWIKVGAMPEYLDAFENIGCAIASRYMELVGFWQTDIGEAGHAHHMWRWKSLNQRQEMRSTLFKDADWQEKYLPAILPLIKSQSVKILHPTAFSPLQ